MALQSGDITLIPKGTTLYEPDAIGRVVLQFPTQDDAIIFYELLREWMQRAAKT